MVKGSPRQGVTVCTSGETRPLSGECTDHVSVKHSGFPSSGREASCELTVVVGTFKCLSLPACGGTGGTWRRSQPGDPTGPRGGDTTLLSVMGEQSLSGADG